MSIFRTRKSQPIDAEVLVGLAANAALVTDLTPMTAALARRRREIDFSERLTEHMVERVSQHPAHRRILASNALTRQTAV